MADATTSTDLVVFTVTPEAIERILELREAEDDPPGLALRVEVTGTSGVEYAYDLTFDPMAEADEADAQFLQGDLPVIVPTGSIDPAGTMTGNSSWRNWASASSASAIGSKVRS